MSPGTKVYLVEKLMTPTATAETAQPPISALPATAEGQAPVATGKQQRSSSHQGCSVTLQEKSYGKNI
jgi:hypothetical protein